MLKKSHLLILMAGVTALAVGCTPSPGQLKKAVEDNPDIVFSAIEKNPELCRETGIGSDYRMKIENAPPVPRKLSGVGATKGATP